MESFYDDECSVKHLSYWHYTHHPKFDAYLVSIVTNDGFEWVGHPKDAPWERIREYAWVSHHRVFDDMVHRRLQEDGIVPSWRPPYWGNSINLCAWIRVPRALAKAVEVLYGIKHSKDIRDREIKGKRWEEFSDDLKRRTKEYALNDGRLALRIWLDHIDEWPEKERRLADMLDDRGLRGIYADKEGMERDMDLMRRIIFAAERKIPWRGTEEKLLSAPACRAECRKQGIPPPASFDMKDESLQEWEDKYGEKYPFVGAMRDLRRINAVLKKYETIYSRIKPDGFFEFSLAYLGTMTGRTAGTDKAEKRQSANMLNLPRDPFFVRPDLTVCHLKKETKGILDYRKKNDGALPDGIRMIDLRAKLLPAPGKKFIIVDKAQIEARITNWLARDKAVLDLIRQGISVYEAHARSLMGYQPVEDPKNPGKTLPLKKHNAYLYSLAKARELALGFGSGHVQFIKMAPLYVDDDEFEAIFNQPYTPAEENAYRGYLLATKQVPLLKEFDAADDYDKRCRVQSWKQVQDFREHKPLLADREIGVWNRMHSDLIRSIGGTHVVVLPSGRKLKYFNVRRHEDEIVARTERGGDERYLYGAKCMAGDTEVLTRDRGWVRLDSVTKDDLVFDGDDWVQHDGLIDQGTKEVIDFGGIKMTRDHKVMTSDGWREAQDTSYAEATRVLQPHEHSHKWVNRIGERFGRLTLIRDAGVDDKQKAVFLAKCDCGTTKIIKASLWAKKCIYSCGCNRFAQIGQKNQKHMMSFHPAYSVWKNAIERCHKKYCHAWKNYGGRGITVCDRWRRSFSNFWEDMGPSYRRGLSLDRIDNNRGYEPDNCRWTDRRTQAANRRTNVFIDTPQGRMCVDEAARVFGINRLTLRGRLSRGWTAEDALTMPPNANLKYRDRKSI